MAFLYTEVNIVPEALSDIVTEAESRWPLETGGILLGSIIEGKAVVRIVVGPGPLAKHSPVSFTRDGKFAQQELERVFQETDGNLDYLGEWHSHTLNIGPSGRDKSSMRLIASSSAYNLEEPILLLCLPSKIVPSRVWKLHSYRQSVHGFEEISVMQL